MAYGARRDAYNKGFATKFEIYVSENESGDDFYLAGSGSYSDHLMTLYSSTWAK